MHNKPTRLTLAIKRSVLCLLIVGLPAAAQDIIRSDKPLQISADDVFVDELASITVYEGNVAIVQGSSLITGDKVVVEVDQADHERYEATGAPAHLEFLQEEEVELVIGRAETMIYTLEQEMVDLIGDAELDRGTDHLAGSRIAYFASTDRATVVADEVGERVRATYYPARRRVPTTGSTSP